MSNDLQTNLGINIFQIIILAARLIFFAQECIIAVCAFQESFHFRFIKL